MPSLSRIVLRPESFHSSENKLAKNGLILLTVDFNVWNTLPPIFKLISLSSLQSWIAFSIAATRISSCFLHFSYSLSSSFCSFANSFRSISSCFNFLWIVHSIVLFSSRKLVIVLSELKFNLNVSRFAQNTVVAAARQEILPFFDSLTSVSFCSVSFCSVISSTFCSGGFIVNYFYQYRNNF